MLNITQLEWLCQECVAQGQGGQLVCLAGMSVKITAGGGKAPDLAMEGWHVGHVY